MGGSKLNQDFVRGRIRTGLSMPSPGYSSPSLLNTDAAGSLGHGYLEGKVVGWCTPRIWQENASRKSRRLGSHSRALAHLASLCLLSLRQCSQDSVASSPARHRLKEHGAATLPTAEFMQRKLRRARGANDARE